MLLCGDDSLAPWRADNVLAGNIRERNAVRNRLVEEKGEDISSRINQARLAWIDSFLSELGEEPGARNGRDWAHVFGTYAMHPLFGIPILFLVLVLAYEFVGVFGAGFLVDLMEEGLFGKWGGPAARLAVG